MTVRPKLSIWRDIHLELPTGDKDGSWGYETWPLERERHKSFNPTCVGSALDLLPERDGVTKVTRSEGLCFIRYMCRRVVVLLFIQTIEVPDQGTLKHTVI